MTCTHVTMRALALRRGWGCPGCGEGRLVRPSAPRYSAADVAARGAAAGAERMRRSLSLFFKRAWHVLEGDLELEWNWHHEDICAHLEHVLKQWMVARRTPIHKRPPKPLDYQFLLYNVPPGSMKSRLLTVANAWMWLPGNAPTWRVTVTSASDAVVKRDAEFFQKLITSQWYLETFKPKWTLTETSAYSLTNSAGGVRLSRPFQTTITGMRGDAIFVDDPDDAKMVFGDAYREARSSKWRNSWKSRVNDARIAVYVGIQQRTHSDDWTAQILEEHTVCHRVLPLRWRAGLPKSPIGVDDPRTVEGEVIHPARFPPDVIHELAKAQYVLDTQYDQQPTRLDGGMFKRAAWRFFTVDGSTVARQRPEGCTDAPPVALGWVHRSARQKPRLDVEAIAISLDATMGSKKKAGSAVALFAVGIRGADRFVLEDRTEQMDYPTTRDALKKIVADVAERYGMPHDCVLVELKANGQAVVDELAGSISGVIGVNPHGGKEARASAMMPGQWAGNWHLLEGASWLFPRHDAEGKEIDEGFVKEVSAHPNGKRDDRGDALSQLDTHYREDGELAAARRLTTL